MKQEKKLGDVTGSQSKDSYRLKELRLKAGDFLLTMMMMMMMFRWGCSVKTSGLPQETNTPKHLHF